MAIEVVDNSPQEDRPQEEVYLLGEGPYIFTYPKMGRILNTHVRIKGLPKDKAEQEMVESMLEWLKRGFGPDAWAWIMKRQDNDDDRLDTEHLIETFRLLVQARAGRPTTSSTAASPQPWMKSSTGEQSAEESDSETPTFETSAT